MKTSVETIDDLNVKLTVEVEPQRVKQAFDRAARELAKQVNLPGFRPGKAPRRILEQRLGTGAVAQAALEDAISDYYVEALQEERINPVGQPELDVERFDEKEGCAFTATVEVRPKFEPPDHTGITVTHPDWQADDDDIAEQLESLRERFAEVDEVDRAAEAGDLVTLDLTVEIDGEVLEDTKVTDALYEIGSGGVTPTLDEEIIGKQAGDDFTYVDTLPEGYPEHGGAEATFRVHVTDVREKTLPELDDDFAMTASAFDTIGELRADLRNTVLRYRIESAQHELRSNVLEAYLARVDIPLPAAMIDSEVEERLHRIEHQAQQYGMEADALLEAQGTTREEFETTARDEATNAVKARIVLDELAEKMSVGFEADDIEEEIVRHAQRSGMAPEKVAEIIQQQGSLPMLVGDIMRRKAIDEIVAAASVEGAPDDQTLIEVGLLPDPEAVGNVDADGDGATDETASGLIVPGAAGSGDDDAAGEEPKLIVPGRD
ncbi:MAG: trigger factor [Nitriliruptoraceae bacterium]